MSRTSTKEKSKTPSQFNIGHVASFVAKLRNKATAMRIPILMGPYGPTLLFDSEGTPINNMNNAKRHACSMCILGWIRYLKEDWSKRSTGKKEKRLKKATGHTMDAREIKILIEIDSFESGSHDFDDGLSGGNDNTNHTKAPNDSNYFEGDD
jgi:hypothetical protein